MKKTLLFLSIILLGITITPREAFSAVCDPNQFDSSKAYTAHSPQICKPGECQSGDPKQVPLGGGYVDTQRTCWPLKAGITVTPTTKPPVGGTGAPTPTKSGGAATATPGPTGTGTNRCTGTNAGTKLCSQIDTGVGTIPLDPILLSVKLLNILLSLSGGIFLLLVIRAGYRMITSQGNPEAVKEARESLTSVIVGFLFLIFSFVILELIGVHILQLPGFS